MGSKHSFQSLRAKGAARHAFRVQLRACCGRSSRGAHVCLVTSIAVLEPKFMRSRSICLMFLSLLIAFPVVSSAAVVAPLQDRHAPATQAQIEALEVAVKNAQAAGDNSWM